MFSNSRTWTVEWGDCDPAGIVFYPRFFAAFDTSTSRLLEAATGMRKSEIIRSNEIIGWPMVETGARFLAPATYGDEMHIESCVTRVGRSSFAITHRMLRAGLLCIEASEVRVWTARRSGESHVISSVPLPESLAAKLRGDA